ncbi:MAG: polysaccharide deacetylase family protein [Coriobacteriia bacterium]|nr:polysaccharide deacetylase family protein [Coriobacteriia bacterium]
MTRIPNRSAARLVVALVLLGASALASGCIGTSWPAAEVAARQETATATSIPSTSLPDTSDTTASALASEAPEDPAGVVSIEPTVGVTSKASSAPWPAYAPALRARWTGVYFRHAAMGRKMVALTFDDGPFANSMVRATDILMRAHAKATFFCVGGRVFHNPDETRYAWSHGMEIDNHTWSHRELTRSRSDDLTQILATDAIIGEVTGVRPLWVRPKSGSADATGVAAVFDSGHLLAGWNVHAGDTGTWTSEQITKHVLETVKPGDVVDLHVTNPRTIQALPGMLAGLKARGYRMVTLSTLALASQ